MLDVDPGHLQTVPDAVDHPGFGEPYRERLGAAELGAAAGEQARGRDWRVSAGPGNGSRFSETPHGPTDLAAGHRAGRSSTSTRNLTSTRRCPTWPCSTSNALVATPGAALLVCRATAPKSPPGRSTLTPAASPSVCSWDRRRCDLPMIVYSDLDGTMVGPRGCFFRAADRSVTLEPAGALADLLEAGGTLVLVSGRTRAQLQEAALIFGADGFVAELGALVAWDSGRQAAALPAGEPARDDLVAALLARFSGRLELHAPWHLGHEVDVMLRGSVDDAEIREWLEGIGFGHLELRDNGVLPPRRETGLTVPGPLHVYHLLPAGISKGAAVAWDLTRRGLRAEDAVAIGDSQSDLSMAATVGRFFLVANGAEHVTDLPTNAAVTAGPLGAGWAEAVRHATGLA